MSSSSGGVRLAVVAAIAFVLSGCAPRGLQLYTHPNPRAPNLHGKTVASFPPLSLGAERGPAIVARDVLDAVFVSEISGIRFLSPTEVVALTDLSDDEAAKLAEQMDTFLPVDVEPTRKRIRLFSGERVGDTPLERKLTVTLQRDPYPKKQLSPALLPASLFDGLDADYVLLTVAFSSYHQVSRTAAMLGILPLAWARELRADGPRSLFALYEVESGARVWDVIVGFGSHVRPEQATREAGRIVDPRIMPVVGMVYLLTGDFVTPLERAIRERVAE